MNESNKVTNYLIIGEWITLVGLFIAAFSFIQGQMQHQTERSDDLHKEFISQIQHQTERSDDLHKEFISLLKEGRK